MDPQPSIAGDRFVLPRSVARPGVLALALLIAACGRPDPIPPTPAPPSAATFVAASFDLTWNAALDYFAEVGVPIARRDPGSGSITTERVVVDRSFAGEYADCGAVPSGSELDRILATSVVYTVTVRDDGNSSSVLATASWEAPDDGPPFSCETTRVWEDETQRAIKLTAEANRQ